MRLHNGAEIVGRASRHSASGDELAAIERAGLRPLSRKASRGSQEHEKRSWEATGAPARQSFFDEKSGISTSRGSPWNGTKRNETERYANGL